MSVNVDQSYPHEWRVSTHTPTPSMSKLANISEASDPDVVAWAREGDEDAYRELCANGMWWPRTSRNRNRSRMF